MQSLIVTAILVGKLVVTSYRAVPEQTDDSPFYTSTNEHVRAGGCAISRDMLCPACRKLHHRCKHPENENKLHYGDWLYVEGFGYRQVNDAMSKREHYRIETNHGRKSLFKTIRRHIDIFVWTWKQEHAVGVRKETVWRLNETFTDNGGR